MLRAVIVDDEPLALKNLEKMLSQLEGIEIVQSFTNGKNLLNNIHNLDCHVIFLDIEMPGINGIELATILNENGKGLHIVFITAYRDYAVEAFEVNSTDYLLKPISKSRLEATIQRVRNQLKLGVDQTSNQPKDKFPLKIQCFGSFNVFFNNEILPWRTSKMRELFAYLLQNQPTPVHKDIIIDRLWGDDDYEKARVKLYTTISYIRKSFSSIGYDNIIGTVNGSYFLNPIKFHCDAANLEAFMNSDLLIDANNFELAEEIFNSYKGNYMQSNGYDWSATKERYFHDQVLLLGKMLVEYYSQSEQYEKRERVLLALLKLEPFEETYIQQLLVHYNETKNRLAAREVYTQYKNQLLKELNLLPSNETVKLYKELMQMTPS